jgi:hypothetical protein
MFERIIGVFRLDKKTFSEIEHDQSATSQAAIVVAIVAALSVVGVVIGALVGVVTGGRELGPALGGSVVSIVLTFLMAFVNWFLWSAITFFVGTKLFGGEADMGEMLRVIGFAQAPQMLQIIPCIGGIVGWIWSMIAAFFAIQEGLDLDTGKTLATVVIGWLIILVINLIIGMVFGVSLAGVGALTSLFGG